ncbi:MAG TPA: sulfur carrier protein ThiS [Castellaniella sp.]|uniref:sulfur carrier protein ThiS n=1 Tax=Castellaniella sp. TaxID=1955812 RepID=UPI002EE4F78B
MLIHLNGTPHDVPEKATLHQVLALLAVPVDQADAPVATALNGVHVARSKRDQTLLAPGDQITTFEPITGG